MSTHTTFCVVCNSAVYCCDDVHGLGVGGKRGEGGCDNPPYIEFCSLEHAEELYRRLGEQIAYFKARDDVDEGTPGGLRYKTLVQCGETVCVVCGGDASAVGSSLRRDAEQETLTGEG